MCTVLEGILFVSAFREALSLLRLLLNGQKEKPKRINPTNHIITSLETLGTSIMRNWKNCITACSSSTVVSASLKVTSPGCWLGLWLDVLTSNCMRHKQCQVATAMMLCRFFGVAVFAMLKGSPHLAAIVCSSPFLNFLSSMTWSILLTWESNCFCLLMLRSLRMAATQDFVLLTLLERLSDSTSVGSLRMSALLLP